jgi:hypothetical protein
LITINKLTNKEQKYVEWFTTILSIFHHLTHYSDLIVNIIIEFTLIFSHLCSSSCSSLLFGFLLFFTCIFSIFSSFINLFCHSILYEQPIVDRWPFYITQQRRKSTVCFVSFLFFLSYLVSLNYSKNTINNNENESKWEMNLYCWFDQHFGLPPTDLKAVWWIIHANFILGMLVIVRKI